MKGLAFMCADGSGAPGGEVKALWALESCTFFRKQPKLKEFEKHLFVFALINC